MSRTCISPATTCWSRSVRRTAFPWIERDIGIEFDAWGMPVVDKLTMAASRPGVFFGGDAAFGPKNIIWAVAHGHDAAISIDKYCRGEDMAKRPPPHTNLISQKMGIHEWSYDNAITPQKRHKVPLKDKVIALASIRVEVELGFDLKQAYAETQRCLNCDVQTVFNDKLCIECDACVDICPMDCITFAENGDEAELRPRLQAPAIEPDAGPLRVGAAQDGPHHGEGRGRLPALRPLRGALSDGRLGHAEVPARDGACGRSAAPRFSGAIAGAGSAGGGLR